MTLSAAGVERAPGGALRKFVLEPRYLISFLITVILVAGEWRYQILGGYERLAIALGCAIATEVVLSRLLRGVWPNVQSAYITGISTTLLTKPLTGVVWPFAVVAILSIMSKYVLTWRGRHLWNPTNFGISCMLLVAPGAMAVLGHEFGNEWGTNLVIWCLGLLIVSRAKLLHVTLTYAASFCVFALLRSRINGTPSLVEIAPITGPMYQLFCFFMVTDPRTTVRSRNGRILVAFLVGAMECAIRLGNDFHVPMAHAFAPAPALFALAIVGPTAMFIDLARPKRPAIAARAA
jgi:Na+-transporting NADH:ubiquinone oxidoreductase subunit NqrB